MQVFYAPGIKGDSWRLDETESKHIVRVLRMRHGDPVRLIDGKGNLYEGFISEADPKACEISIKSTVPGFEKRPYYLHIAISPLKNPERFEWFVEKSVEIGVDEITPLICRNTERVRIKHERISSIIVSAMKQSLKAGDTLLNEPVAFDELISSGHRGSSYLAHCSERTSRSGLSEVYTKGNDALILIGPEGDFSDEEIGRATEKGFIPVHLGRSRLRTETAGIVACHSFYFINL
jgi:16S rRNA (uracil1498-N3)-methyltransferase